MSLNKFTLILYISTALFQTSIISLQNEKTQFSQRRIILERVKRWGIKLFTFLETKTEKQYGLKISKGY